MAFLLQSVKSRIHSWLPKLSRDDFIPISSKDNIDNEDDNVIGNNDTTTDILRDDGDEDIDEDLYSSLGSGGVRAYTGIVYNQDGNDNADDNKRRRYEMERRRLDVYTPAAAAQATATTAGGYGSAAATANLMSSPLSPVIVYMHGGAWLLGDRDESNSKQVCESMAREGFVTVSVSYRLTSVSNNSLTSAFLFLSVIFGLLGLVSTLAEKALLMGIWLVLVLVLIIVMMRRPPLSLRHPCHVTDCAQAVRWVYDHIDDYGGDPDRITLMGHSAGAHLTSLLCTNSKFLRAEGLDPGQHITAGVCISGVYNDRALRSGSLATNLLYETFGSKQEDHVDAFPIYHLRPDRCPPLLVLSAERDYGLKRQALEFLSTARSNGVYAEASVYKNTNHYSIILGWDKENWKVVRDVSHFINRAVIARKDGGRDAGGRRRDVYIE